MSLLPYSRRIQYSSRVTTNYRLYYETTYIFTAESIYFLVNDLKNIHKKKGIARHETVAYSSVSCFGGVV